MLFDYSWWLNRTNPFETYAQVKLDHETPRIGVKKIFETTTQLNFFVCNTQKSRFTERFWLKNSDFHKLYILRAGLKLRSKSEIAQVSTVPFFICLSCSCRSNILWCKLFGPNNSHSNDLSLAPVWCKWILKGSNCAWQHAINMHQQCSSVKRKEVKLNKLSWVDTLPATNIARENRPPQ